MTAIASKPEQPHVFRSSVAVAPVGAPRSNPLTSSAQPTPALAGRRPSTASRRSLAGSVLCASLALLACGGAGPTEGPPRAAAPLPKASSDGAAWRSVAPKPQPELGFSYPVPEVIALDNGMRVYLLPRQTAHFAASVVIKRGSLADPDGESGVAALTARMLTEGSQAKNTLELAEATEDLGSQMLTEVSHDRTELSFQFLAEDLSRALALMTEVLATPRFAPDVFERVRREWLDALKETRQDPAGLAHVVGMRVSLPGSLGQPTQGSLNNVEALVPKHLRQFHDQHYRPENTALVLAGPTQTPELAALVKATFGAWRPRPFHPKAQLRPANSKGLVPAAAPRAKPETAPARTDLHFSKATIVDRPGSVQSALFVSLPLPRRSEAGYEARLLLNQVLGGMFTSRLNQNLREKHGFTYGARSFNYATEAFGLWLLQTSVRSEVTAEALREILHELGAIHDARPPATAELERGRKELLGGYAQSLEDGASLADNIADLFVDALPATYFENLGNELARLDRAALAHEAQQYFRGHAPKLVIVGDKAHFADSLTALAAAIELADPRLLD